MQTSLDYPSQDKLVLGDQARKLRALVALRPASAEDCRSTDRRCHTIVVSGGKGGVGRSVIALNLAIALAQRGASVGLLDACPDLGNIELLCGLNGYWNLSHVVQGCRQLDEVMQTGPAGVRIVSGASCLADPSFAPMPAMVQLREFERELDWLIVDASGGACGLTRQFALAADDVLIVTTPEATAVAEAYASVKSLAKTVGPRMGLLVNQADSVPQAQQILDRLQQAVHSFLRVDLHRRGYLPRDIAVPNSVNARVPFVLQSPRSPVTAALLQLIQRWTRPQPTEDITPFFSRLQMCEE